MFFGRKFTHMRILSGGSRQAIEELEVPPNHTDKKEEQKMSSMQNKL